MPCWKICTPSLIHISVTVAIISIQCCKTDTFLSLASLQNVVCFYCTLFQYACHVFCILNDVQHLNNLHNIILVSHFCWHTSYTIYVRLLLRFIHLFCSLLLRYHYTFWTKVVWKDPAMWHASQSKAFISTENFLWKLKG